MFSRLEAFWGFSQSERVSKILAFAYFFLLITSYYVLKPIRESLAIELGSGKIPALNVLSAISLVGANAGYSWIVGKYKREIFIPGITRAFMICLVFFWIAFQDLDNASSLQTPLWSVKGILISVYFIWVNLFVLFVVTMFWSFMNDVFSSEQGRRLYEFIGYGGLIGGVCGGWLTSLFVNHLGTASLFLVAMSILEPTVWCMRIIHRFNISKQNENESRPNTPPLQKKEGEIPSRLYVFQSLKQRFSGSLDGAVLTIASPFLALMALETFFYTFGASLFSFQINRLIEQTNLPLDLRVNFWAQLFNKINITSLFTQLIVTKLVMKSKFPISGLLLISLTQITGSFCLIGYPILDVATITVIIRSALNYSTGRAVRELLFTPLPRNEKYQAKCFIDTFVFRAGDGAASGVLLLGLPIFGNNLRIDFVILCTMFLSVLVISSLGRRFKMFDGAKER